MFKGRHGLIVDKGDDILSGGKPGGHIVIQFTEGSGHPTRRVHEDVVNRYLKQHKKLWVDFNHRMNSYKN
jgi:hypothetical protein